MGKSVKRSIKKVEEHGSRGRMTISHHQKQKPRSAEAGTYRSIYPVHTDNQQLSST